MLKPTNLFSQLFSEIFTAVNFDKLVAKWGAGCHVKVFCSKKVAHPHTLLTSVGRRFSLGNRQQPQLL